MSAADSKTAPAPAPATVTTTTETTETKPLPAEIEMKATTAAVSLVDSVEMWDLMVGGQLFSVPQKRIVGSLPGLYQLLVPPSSSPPLLPTLLGTLSRIVQPSRTIIRQSDTKYVVEGDPTTFRYILSWLRGDENFLTKLAPAELAMLRSEAKAFGIPALVRQITWLLCDGPDALDPKRCEDFRSTAGHLYILLHSVRGKHPLLDAIVTGLESLRDNDVDVLSEMSTNERLELSRRNWEDILDQLMKSSTIQRYLLRSGQSPSQLERQKFQELELQCNMISQSLTNLCDRHSYPIPNIQPLVEFCTRIVLGGRMRLLGMSTFARRLKDDSIESKLPTTTTTASTSTLAEDFKQSLIDRAFKLWMTDLETECIKEYTIQNSEKPTETVPDLYQHVDKWGLVKDWVLATLNVVTRDYARDFKDDQSGVSPTPDREEDPLKKQDSLSTKEEPVSPGAESEEWSSEEEVSKRNISVVMNGRQAMPSPEIRPQTGRPPEAKLVAHPDKPNDTTDETDSLLFNVMLVNHASPAAAIVQAPRKVPAAVIRAPVAKG